jgi:hypothetical protein
VQKWEYLYVQLDEGEKGVWRPRKINGQDVPNWKKGPAVDAFSNQMGGLGWELVSTPFASNGTDMIVDFRLIFKRPREL